MIEIYVPNNDVETFKEKAEAFKVINVWRTRTNDQISLFKVLVEKQYTEDILDFLETEHESLKNFMPFYMIFQRIYRGLTTKKKKRQR